MTALILGLVSTALFASSLYFPTKMESIFPSFLSVAASCWNCQEICLGKTKYRLQDRKTEHFKAITSSCHAPAIADYVTSTGNNLKWDHFDILAKGRSDTHYKIKETPSIK